MNEISKNIFNGYQARKTEKQKSRFIDFYKMSLSELGIKIDIEEGRLFKSKNIIVGDLNKADIIFTAHYDTASKNILPIPMITIPNNKFLTFVIQIVPITLMAFGLRQLFILMSFPSIMFDLILVFIIGLAFMGSTNHNTANDNTSGVIVLNEMICQSKKNLDRVAFVFFDHEEIGIVGSCFFAKKHKELLKDKLIVNLDCVSEGNHVMIMKNKNIFHKDKIDSLINSSFFNIPPGKKLYNEDKCDYSSDNRHFKNSIAIAICNESIILGKYISKIHTSKDRVFDISNIDFITDSLLNMIRNS